MEIELTEKEYKQLLIVVKHSAGKFEEMAGVSLLHGKKHNYNGFMRLAGVHRSLLKKLSALDPDISASYNEATP